MARCKFRKREHQVSYNDGQTWETIEVIKGDLVEYESSDCQEGSEITKWVTLDNDFICDGKNKYKKQVLYASYDDGVSWYVYFPTVYQKGEYVGVDEAFCNNKIDGHYDIDTGTVIKIDPIKIVKCEGDDSTLTQSDVQYYGNIDRHPVNITSATIGDCVTSIGNNAFNECGGLLFINIPSGVTSIGNYAFSRCTSLTSIDIPNGVTSIGNSAFSGCSSLTSINIPSGVTSIGNYAFYRCSGLTDATINGGSIGNYAFSGCSSLTNITIPSGVTSIGNYAFNGCSSLTDAVINGGSIGSWAFYDCTSLSSCTIGSGVTSIGQYAFQLCSGLTDATINGGSIGHSAFNYCTSLSSCTIGSGVTSIGNYAFACCSSLTSIDIPSGVTSIGNSAFGSCIGLTSATINATTPPTLGTDVFDDTSCQICVPCESVDTYRTASGWSEYADRIQGYPSCYEPQYRELNTATTCVGFDKYVLTEYQVSYNSGQTWETTATSATTLIEANCDECCKFKAIYNGGQGYSALCDSNTSLTTATTKPSGYEYSAMTSAYIGDCVTVIYSRAFYGCTSLSAVTIPSGVTEVEIEAFANCSSLTSIDLPSGVTVIACSAFTNCTSLESITIRATTPPTIYDCDELTNTNNCPIYVPSRRVYTYRNHRKWKKYASRIRAIPSS